MEDSLREKHLLLERDAARLEQAGPLFVEEKWPDNKLRPRSVKSSANVDKQGGCRVVRTPSSLQKQNANVSWNFRASTGDGTGLEPADFCNHRSPQLGPKQPAKRLGDGTIACDASPIVQRERAARLARHGGHPAATEGHRDPVAASSEVNVGKEMVDRWTAEGQQLHRNLVGANSFAAPARLDGIPNFGNQGVASWRFRWRGQPAANGSDVVTESGLVGVKGAEAEVLHEEIAPCLARLQGSGSHGAITTLENSQNPESLLASPPG